jgi:hypothetical protein
MQDPAIIAQQLEEKPQPRQSVKGPKRATSVLSNLASVKGPKRATSVLSNEEEEEMGEAADVLGSMSIKKAAKPQPVARSSPRASSRSVSQEPTSVGPKKRKSAAPPSARGKKSKLSIVKDEKDIKDELESSVIVPADVPKQAEFRVMFTGLDEDDIKKERAILVNLGAELVENIHECTHLITDKVRRTVKFLSAVSIPFLIFSYHRASI